ncbi:hypothetical protein HMPREF0813_01132 [Streptococcus anginosus F0211]|uniref:Uncharacterized protein n=1 Tax=Streptococcus anginosus F0211 TaxID=706437 RepID=E6J1K7_STRAP|nr:hypothetical protein SanJ4206_1668c [Streptococcus anginosus]EFU22236.1 hypothetical protein HMPREF0813_01132 [Streptococcus anginosus F0211]ETS94826.1 hypothetical protein HMPREF1512_1268 [Streptococcus sp. OBRC6]EUB12493.1 hypothetical protein HMPREF1510_1660 [Streptococcus sp. ACC21]EWC98246.1 hypothetical protein HMPREF1509_0721 [Streptococcus sp. AC15]
MKSSFYETTDFCPTLFLHIFHLASGNEREMKIFERNDIPC